MYDIYPSSEYIGIQKKQQIIFWIFLYAWLNGHWDRYIYYYILFSVLCNVPFKIKTFSNRY